jgi:hypothetical protein
MMLELLMIRQNTLDQAVASNANDLDFIVLDELHTYRGRQGADVAGAAKIFGICAEGQGIICVSRSLFYEALGGSIL